MSTTPREWPWAVSTINRSTPASTSVIARFQPSSKKPTAAATRNRPASSLVASGYCSDLVKSLTVMRPRNRPLSSTSGSFSILCLARSAIASAGAMPGAAVTSGIRVMMSPAVREWSVSKRRSRFVTMPSKRPSPSTTGSPDTL